MPTRKTKQTVMSTKKKKPKSIEELTKGFETFIKGKEETQENKELFEEGLKKLVPSKQDSKDSKK